MHWNAVNDIWLPCITSKIAGLHAWVTHGMSYLSLQVCTFTSALYDGVHAYADHMIIQAGSIRLCLVIVADLKTN